MATPTANPNANPNAAIDTLPLACFDDVPEDFLCCVCQVPRSNNVTLCVGMHNACRECADTMRNDRASCPMCNTEFMRPGGTWLTNRAINSAVAEVLLSCANKEHGCTHRCKLAELDAHAAVCEYATVPCPCASAGGEGGGCAWRGRRSQLDAHLVEVDHSRWIVGLMQESNDRVAHATARVAELEERFSSYRAAAAVAVSDGERERGELKRDIAKISNQCESILGYVNRRDGSSVRSRQRDKKNAKDVAAARVAAEEAREKQATAEGELAARLTERDEYAERNERLAFDKQVLEDQKAELMQRSVTHERQFVEQTADLKRAREDRDGFMDASMRANTALHEQHFLLCKMAPAAAPRGCPCSRCRRRHPPNPIRAVQPIVR
jgi:rubredoxin